MKSSSEMHENDLLSHSAFCLENGALVTSRDVAFITQEVGHFVEAAPTCGSMLALSLLNHFDINPSEVPQFFIAKKFRRRLESGDPDLPTQLQAWFEELASHGLKLRQLLLKGCSESSAEYDGQTVTTPLQLLLELIAPAIMAHSYQVARAACFALRQLCMPESTTATMDATSAGTRSIYRVICWNWLVGDPKLRLSISKKGRGGLSGRDAPLPGLEVLVNCGLTHASLKRTVLLIALQMAGKEHLSDLVSEHISRLAPSQDEAVSLMHATGLALHDLALLWLSTTSSKQSDCDEGITDIYSQAIGAAVKRVIEKMGSWTNTGFSEKMNGDALESLGDVSSLFLEAGIMKGFPALIDFMSGGLGSSSPELMRHSAVRASFQVLHALAQHGTGGKRFKSLLRAVLFQLVEQWTDVGFRAQVLGEVRSLMKQNTDLPLQELIEPLVRLEKMDNFEGSIARESNLLLSIAQHPNLTAVQARGLLSVMFPLAKNTDEMVQENLHGPLMFLVHKFGEDEKVWKHIVHQMSQVIIWLQECNDEEEANNASDVLEKVIRLKKEKLNSGLKLFLAEQLEAGCSEMSLSLITHLYQITGGSLSELSLGQHKNGRNKPTITQREEESPWSRTRKKSFQAPFSVGASEHSTQSQSIAASHSTLQKENKDCTSEKLPPDWIEVVDPVTKEVYYWNTRTDATSWERPKDKQPQKMKHVQEKPKENLKAEGHIQKGNGKIIAFEAAPLPLLPGWKEAIDPDTGDTYYWNTKTNETSWERPSASPVAKPPIQRENEKGVSPKANAYKNLVGENVIDQPMQQSSSKTDLNSKDRELMLGGKVLFHKSNKRSVKRESALEQREGVSRLRLPDIRSAPNSNASSKREYQSTRSASEAKVNKPSLKERPSTDDVQKLRDKERLGFSPRKKITTPRVKLQSYMEDPSEDNAGKVEKAEIARRKAEKKQQMLEFEKSLRRKKHADLLKQKLAVQKLEKEAKLQEEEQKKKKEQEDKIRAQMEKEAKEKKRLAEIKLKVDQYKKEKEQENLIKKKEEEEEQAAKEKAKKDALREYIQLKNKRQGLTNEPEKQRNIGINYSPVHSSEHSDQDIEEDSLNEY